MEQRISARFRDMLCISVAVRANGLDATDADNRVGEIEPTPIP